MKNECWKRELEKIWDHMDQKYEQKRTDLTLQTIKDKKHVKTQEIEDIVLKRK